MMVQEASNLWKGLALELMQAFKIFSREFSNSFFKVWKIHALQATWKQGPECVLMDKIEGTYSIIVNYEFQKWQS